MQRTNFEYGSPYLTIHHNFFFFFYVMIVVLCVLLIVFVGLYDCCISGKCDRCPSQLLCCRRTAETRLGRQDHVETVTGELDAQHDRPSNTAQNQTPSQAARPPREVTNV